MPDLQRVIFLDRYAAKRGPGDGIPVFNRSQSGPDAQSLGVALHCTDASALVRWDSGREETVPFSRLLFLAETEPEQMYQRLARAVAAAEPESVREEWTGKFLEVLRGPLIPGGRVLAGAGIANARLTSANCFVIPAPLDSREGIIETLKRQVEIMSHGGGVGFHISTLRPSGAIVKGVNGTSTGPMSWANLYSEATGSVEQGGSRRGALMLMIHDWHPDVLEFISVKSRGEQLIKHANLSVLVSDRFMEAVKADGNWDLVFPDLDDPEYNALWRGNLRAWQESGHKVIVYRTLKARDLWRQFAEYAWRRGEPGVVFVDRYNSESNSWYYAPVVATNPCGEQGLPEYAVCNLAAINLAHDSLLDLETMEPNYEALAQVVSTAVRFQDDVIDISNYPLPENAAQQGLERRVGLGVMGLADMLIKLHSRYGSPDALDMVDRTFRTMRDAAYLASTQIAAEKGPFPAFDAEQYLQSGFAKRLPPEIQEQIRQHGMRNVTLLTVAPTGTTSMLAGVSSGIEPVFRFKTLRMDALGDHVMYHPLAEVWLTQHPSEELPGWFVSADQLTPEEHVRMQAIAQRYVDSSISKTVNAPNSHTIEDVERVFNLAYSEGCKGIAYFRDGSVTEVVLAAAEEKPTKPELIERPDRMSGRAYKLKTHFGTVTLDVHELAPGVPFEIFASVGATGTDLMADAAGLGREASVILRMRSDIPPLRRIALIIDKLSDIGGSSSSGFGPARIGSLPSAIARGLQMYLEDVEGGAEVPVQTSQIELCPECGNASLVREEGCQKCHTCGYSRC